MDGDAVIEAQRATGQVKAQADTPVVAEVQGGEGVGIERHLAEVVKDSDSQPVNNGDAVFSRAKPIGVASNGLADSWLTGADIAELKAAEGLKAA